MDMSGTDNLEGFHAAAFTRANNEPDTIFFAQRLPDSLMDMGARTAVTALYQTTLPVGGRVLDLMGGSMSHFPTEAAFQDVVGLDVSKAALDANPAFDERVVQDLNDVPELPFEDESFDAVCLCDGLAYLTRPLTVLGEVVRVLKPGAPLIVTFSDQFHAPKAVAMWQALEPSDRGRLVSVLMSRAGLVELDTGEVVPPEDLTAWQDTVHAVVGRRPVV
ncbi:class I SAM-dependent methyltransferase [Gluconobacter wancherniae]|nr:class I SAM-dependent methyltransferase [Gluconobacter wancherniae]